MAMIQKKNYILRHIFLIIITIIVLFPLVWVVTTSVRRDNAAFSPKLFSSRITFNYYRDLLFPKATVPELIKDMNSTAHFIGENSSLSFDEAREKLNTQISDFETYISETKQYFEDINLRFENILTNINSKYSNEILNDINTARNNEVKNLSEIEKELVTGMDLSEINENISSLKTKINEYLKLRDEARTILNQISITPENKTYISKTFDTIYGLKPGYTLWNIRVYKKWKKLQPDNSELQKLPAIIKSLYANWKDITKTAEQVDAYFATLENEKYGNELSKLKDYESKISSLQKKSNELSSKISEKNKEILKLNGDLNALLEIYAPYGEKLSSAVDIFKKYNLKEKKIYTLEMQKLMDNAKYLSNAFTTINENFVLFDDFKEYKTYIESFASSFIWINDNAVKIYSNKDVEFLNPAYKTITGVIEAINPTIKTFENLVLTLATNIKEAETLDSEYSRIKTELEKYNNEYNTLYNSLKTEFDKFDKLKNYGELLMVKEFINADVNNYEEAQFISTLLNSKIFKYYKPDKKDINIFTLKENIEEANEKFQKSLVSFNKIIEEFESQLAELKNNSDDYLKLNYGGYTADILPIMQISSIYNSKYGPAKADLSRSSRIVSDLSDSVKYKALKSDLRKIDGNIYNLLDKWNPKQRKPFLRWLMNSIIVAGITAILTVLMTAVAAYPFSRMRFKGRKEGLLYLMLIQMFPAIMYMVALYGILKFMGDYFGFIGLDTLSGLIFVYLGGVAFNMWLIKGYYDTIPDSLEESAMIDGATRFQTFWLIVLPLASPILAVVTILSFMGTFNEFVMARIVLASEQNFTYAVGLQTFSSGPFETEWGLFTAAALLGAVPMVILFLSMQKYLVGGLTQGSVKG
ncbi:hypothetical protein LN42_08635 [Marinitoga sp. 1137]|uniref:sugar ABC transporter permease n=1 Tax=Marinitoga sp. 1137 TaxID=1545835 RepID=UPI000950B616|nr:sugar ABC transporter permease [Marinitoga sp. 1137]APT76434.1 hypothetical protein LN42_08635 [Marinitoga sp. 1137]